MTRIPWSVEIACVSGVSALLLVCTDVGCAQDRRRHDWLTVTPAVWFTNVDGTSEIGDMTIHVNDSVLDLGFDIRAETGNRRIRGIVTLSRAETVNTARILVDDMPGRTITGYDFAVWTAELFGAIQAGSIGAADAAEFFGGLRYVRQHLILDTDAGAPLGPTTESWLEPVVGARYSSFLGPRGWAAVVADMGGFGAGSDFTWRLEAVVGIRVAAPLNLTMRYKYLEADYTKGTAYGWRGVSQGWIFGAAVKR